VCSSGSVSDGQGVENMVYRQCMLLTPQDISVTFDKLESIVGDIGRPGGSQQGGHHLLFSEAFKLELGRH